MKRMSRMCLSVVVVSGLAATAQAKLVNGDFEATPFDAGWSNSVGAVAGGGLTAGSTTSAYIPAVAQAPFQQTLSSPTNSDWAFETLFASAANVGRMFQMQLQHEPQTGLSLHGQINLIITSTGVQVFETGTTGGASNGFRTIITAPVVASADANGNRSFNDPGDALTAYKLRITGDYDASSPSYAVSLLNAATGVVVGSASDVRFWQYNAPAVNGAIYQVEFASNASGSAYAIDNVIIPEPAAIGLLGGGSTRGAAADATLR